MICRNSFTHEYLGHIFQVSVGNEKKNNANECKRIDNLLSFVVVGVVVAVNTCSIFYFICFQNSSMPCCHCFYTVHHILSFQHEINERKPWIDLWILNLIFFIPLLLLSLYTSAQKKLKKKKNNHEEEKWNIFCF